MTSKLSLSRLSRLLFPFLLLCAIGCGYRATNSQSLDKAEAVRLAALNPDNYGRPVHLEAVVTYYDPEWHLLFVQDSSGGVFVNLQEPVAGLEEGTHLAIQGKLGPSSIGIEDPHFQLLGIAPMPSPQSLPAGADPLQLRLSQWVQVNGTIRLASFEDGRLTLTVVNGAQRTKVRILDRKQINPASLVGTKVQLSGVSAAATDDKGNLNGVQVFVSSVQNLHIDGKLGYPYSTQPDPFWLALHPPNSGDLVHLAGTVVEQTQDRVLVLSDGSLTVKALLCDFSQFAPGDSVELLGFTTKSADYQIEDAIVRMVAPRHPLDESHIAGALRTLRELKSLSVESAAKQLPVDVQGRVTFFDSSASLLFVQDATAGVYINIHNISADLHLDLGDLVHVQGVSAAGDYAPIIAQPTIKVLAHGPLPVARVLSPEVLASGNSDGSWVQVTGIVHSVRQLQSQHIFMLEIGGHSFSVQFPRSQDTSALQDRLLDAQVRVNVICGTIFNEKRQMTGIKFFVPDMASVEIIEPAPPESTRSVRPIVTLLRFDPLNLSVHRVKVRGVVTLQDAKQNFYLQDSSAGIYVVAEEKTPLRPGQVVEVSGFPVADPEGPYLDDASVDMSDVVSQVTPVKLTPDEMSAGSYNSHLVKVEGRLLEQVGTPDHSTMLLQSGQTVLRVRLPGVNVPAGVRRGSLLEVTGVLQDEDQTGQSSYRIALRSADDIRVLQSASWWTPEHTVRTSAGAVIAILIVLLWVLVSAYRVRSHQAKHDSLTGLQNRNATLEYLERQMARAIREQSSIGIILADIDHFKKVNDTHGHLAGDAVLRKISTILSTDLRPYDVVGRYGGEEFLIIVPNCDAAMARDVAERIRTRIQQEKFAAVIPAASLPISCSFGIAIANDTSWSVDSILASADYALYEAKNSGRNRTVLANGSSAHTSR
jgi:diguanylate cyclase (GGDEF)-like protein